MCFIFFEICRRQKCILIILYFTDANGRPVRWYTETRTLYKKQPKTEFAANSLLRRVYVFLLLLKNKPFRHYVWVCVYINAFYWRGFPVLICSGEVKHFFFFFTARRLEKRNFIFQQDLLSSVYSDIIISKK